MRLNADYRGVYILICALLLQIKLFSASFWVLFLVGVAFFFCIPIFLTLPQIGLMFSHLMKFSNRHGFIDRESYVAQYLALAIFTTGIVSTVGSDDLLAAFAAGLSFFSFSHLLQQYNNTL